VFQKATITEEKHRTISGDTLATLSPIGLGRCGDLVAKTPILPPFNLGTLTFHEKAEDSISSTQYPLQHSEEYSFISEKGTTKGLRTKPYLSF